MLPPHLVGITAADAKQRVQPPTDLAPARQVGLEECLGIIPIIPRLGRITRQKRRLHHITEPPQPLPGHRVPAPWLHVRPARCARRHIQQVLHCRARHRRRQKRRNDRRDVIAASTTDPDTSSSMVCNPRHERHHSDLLGGRAGVNPPAGVQGAASEEDSRAGLKKLKGRQHQRLVPAASGATIVHSLSPALQLVNHRVDRCQFSGITHPF